MKKFLEPIKSKSARGIRKKLSVNICRCVRGWNDWQEKPYVFQNLFKCTKQSLNCVSTWKSSNTH